MCGEVGYREAWRGTVLGLGSSCVDMVENAAHAYRLDHTRLAPRGSVLGGRVDRRWEQAGEDIGDKIPVAACVPVDVADAAWAGGTIALLVPYMASRHTPGRERSSREGISRERCARETT